MLVFVVDQESRTPSGLPVQQSSTSYLTSDVHVLRSPLMVESCVLVVQLSLQSPIASSGELPNTVSQSSVSPLSSARQLCSSS